MTGFKITLTKGRLLFVLGAALAVIYFYARDPGAGGGFLPCLIYVSTGWHCPGCGSQRAVHALLHGQAAAAAGHNLLFVLALPAALPVTAIVARWPQWSRRQWDRHGGWILAAAFTLTGLFGLLRNLPHPAFQALAP
jgi:hypothetical protein